MRTVRTRDVIKELRLLKEQEKQIEERRKWLRTVGCKHPKTHQKYWPRRIAEDDPWTECLACGKPLD
jgi:hypothetical protein